MPPGQTHLPDFPKPQTGSPHQTPTGCQEVGRAVLCAPPRAARCAARRGLRALPNRGTSRPEVVFLTLLSLLWPTFTALAASPKVPTPGYQPSAIRPPVIARELRGVWVATVANLDWPSTNALSSDQQKRELVAILDRAAALRLNAVVFQVRPACDAMYHSSIEPWSEYLTGTMGKAPQPYYDPLEFAVQEAHRRGLELHAWFNPYRARHTVAKSPVAANHISRTRPDLVHQVGNYLWLDPGERDVQDYSLGVVMDVVGRYDIDGVTFDDYFYPDKQDTGSKQDFPDGASWSRFGAGGKLSREDWRRENVNRFIERVYTSIKARKPWVKFGISPSGIWRPKNPAQIKGKDSYAEHFADSRLWLAKGWVDYFSPQLYWPIELPDQSFPVLLKWWAGQNGRHRLLCPSLNTYNVGRKWQAEEVMNQIRWTRRLTSPGHLHWRASTLMQNGGLDEALSRELYQQPALVPAMPWLGSQNLPQPSLAVGTAENHTRVRFEWKCPGVEAPRFWLLQTRKNGDWTTRILPGVMRFLDCDSPGPDTVSVTAVDRFGNASTPVTVQFQK